MYYTPKYNMWNRGMFMVAKMGKNDLERVRNKNKNKYQSTKITFNTLPQKRNSSLVQLEFFKIVDYINFFGQCSQLLLAIPVRPLVISKFANEKARSLFFGRVYIVACHLPRGSKLRTLSDVATPYRKRATPYTIGL